MHNYIILSEVKILVFEYFSKKWPFSSYFLSSLDENGKILKNTHQIKSFLHKSLDNIVLHYLSQILEKEFIIWRSQIFKSSLLPLPLRTLLHAFWLTVRDLHTVKRWHRCGGNFYISFTCKNDPGPLYRQVPIRLFTVLCLWQCTVILCVIVVHHKRNF